MSQTRIAAAGRAPDRIGPFPGPDPIRPQWFAGLQEHRLGRAVGVNQFGVNLITLEPGGYSALRHWHEGEDELVYVLFGELVLIDDNGEHALGPGDCVGFPAGEPNAHHLVNRSSAPARFLCVGARKRGEDGERTPPPT